MRILGLPASKLASLKIKRHIGREGRKRMEGRGWKDGGTDRGTKGEKAGRRDRQRHKGRKGRGWKDGETDGRRDRQRHKGREGRKGMERRRDRRTERQTEAHRERRQGREVRGLEDGEIDRGT